MKRLRTEGGSLFVIGLAAAFGAGGLYFGWAAIANGDDTFGAAVALTGMTILLLLLGGREILTDLELVGAKIVVPAKVTAIDKSPTMNVNYTLYRWRIRAEGRLPDGGSREFLSPHVLAASQPAVEIGSIVRVNVSPRTGRYRMDMTSVVLTDDEALRARRDPEGWYARRFFIAGMIVLAGWIGLAFLDGSNFAYAWVALPLVACLFVIDFYTAFVRMLGRLRSEAAKTWPASRAPGARDDKER